MSNQRDWFEQLATDYETAVTRNRLWHQHYRATLPLGCDRRVKLWLLTFYANRAERRAEFWRALASRSKT